jgi:hypothetical protein
VVSPFDMTTAELRQAVEEARAMRAEVEQRGKPAASRSIGCCGFRIIFAS